MATPGVKATYILELDDGTRAIVKPVSGEALDLPPGHGVAAEVGTYVFSSRYLRSEQVPPTVARDDLDFGRASVQRWVEDARPARPPDRYPRSQQELVAVQDVFIAVGDRNPSNYMTGSDGGPITHDNGKSFPAPQHEPVIVDSPFVAHLAGQRLSDANLARLHAIDTAALRRDLIDCGHPAPNVDEAIGRLEHMRRTGRIGDDPSITVVRGALDRPQGTFPEHLPVPRTRPDVRPPADAQPSGPWREPPARPAAWDDLPAAQGLHAGDLIHRAPPGDPVHAGLIEEAMDRFFAGRTLADGYVAAPARVYPFDDGVRVTLSLRRGDAFEGAVRISLTRAPDGTLRAHVFDLDLRLVDDVPALHADLVRHLDGWLSASGVRHLDHHPTGAHAHAAAQAGDDWVWDADAQRIATRVEDLAARHGVPDDVRAAAQGLVDRARTLPFGDERFPTPAEFAALGRAHAADGTSPLGQQAFDGITWHARHHVPRIDPGPPRHGPAAGTGGPPPTGSQPPQPRPIGDALASGVPVRVTELPDGNWRVKYEVHLDDGTLAYYRPDDGASYGHAQAYAVNDVAAYELTRATGFDLVPPAVRRTDLPHGPGSLRQAIPGARPADDADLFPPLAEEQMVIEEIVRGNYSRPDSEHLVRPDGSPLVEAHPEDFPTLWPAEGQAGFPPRIDRHLGQPIHPSHLDRLVAVDTGALRQEWVNAGLPVRAADAAIHRFEHLRDSGIIELAQPPMPRRTGLRALRGSRASLPAPPPGPTEQLGLRVTDLLHPDPARTPEAHDLVVRTALERFFGDRIFGGHYGVGVLGTTVLPDGLNVRLVVRDAANGIPPGWFFDLDFHRAPDGAVVARVTRPPRQHGPISARFVNDLLHDLDDWFIASDVASVDFHASSFTRYVLDGELQPPALTGIARTDAYIAARAGHAWVWPADADEVIEHLARIVDDDPTIPAAQAGAARDIVERGRALPFTDERYPTPQEIARLGGHAQGDGPTLGERAFGDGTRWHSRRMPVPHDDGSTWAAAAPSDQLGPESAARLVFDGPSALGDGADGLLREKVEDAMTRVLDRGRYGDGIAPRVAGVDIRPAHTAVAVELHDDAGRLVARADVLLSTDVHRMLHARHTVYSDPARDPDGGTARSLASHLNRWYRDSGATGPPLSP